MTGITRDQQRIYLSDLNNLSPSLQPPPKNTASQFGFTENEVFKALKSYHLSDKESLVKSWLMMGLLSVHRRRIFIIQWSITLFLERETC